MKFTFTQENLIKVQQFIAKYPTGRQASAVLPLLDLAQRQSEGWLPQAAIEAIAEILEMPTIKVLEVASFYSMFNLKPVGKNHIQICGTTPCALRGAEDLKYVCEEFLNIKVGQTTADSKFTLSEVECLGACVNGPIVQINDDYYEDLSTKSFLDLLKGITNGENPQPGSALNRQGSKAIEEPQ